MRTYQPWTKLPRSCEGSLWHVGTDSGPTKSSTIASQNAACASAFLFQGKTDRRRRSSEGSPSFAWVSSGLECSLMAYFDARFVVDNPQLTVHTGKAVSSGCYLIGYLISTPPPAEAIPALWHRASMPGNYTFTRKFHAEGQTICSGKSEGKLELCVNVGSEKGMMNFIFGQ